MALLNFPEVPDPTYVMSQEGYKIATYCWGDDDAPVVFAVHGFASSCKDTWVDTGWIGSLLDAGFRVLGVDQRGHGKSEKPTQPRDYTMPLLVDDIETVLDTYMVDEAVYLGYSLGARVGWQVCCDLADRIDRAVLGGIPDGRPLGRLDLTQARAYIEHGTPVTDQATQNYVKLAERVPENSLEALVALAGGMRFGDEEINLEHIPSQPILVATGSLDAVLEDSRALASELPQGTFLEIEKRHHFNTPGARQFREAGIDFLLAGSE